MLAGPPLAMRAALEAVRAAATKPLGDGLAAELAAYEACLVSDDRKEALAAFAEKRKPSFRGR
jgi:enoyl-CoA hydratase/carnithine racemase